ncbi:MAG: ABC transporter permease [Deltaproteobacteria bacterium]|nr:ABC transporter permease [Deltaproteobacteria bacterium]MBW2253791.1 ABC transporter permease [Deltaproteobacteria bacterium]
MNVLLIARRDFAAALHGLWGYAIVAAVLFVDGLMFNVFAMERTAKFSHDVLEDFFYYTSGTIIIAAVLFTIRSFAEERQTGTEVLLQTSPVSETQIVLGKYLAVMGILGLVTLLTVYMPALVFVNGKVSVGQIAIGYLGLLSLASATAAVGMFGSSLVRSQVVAAIMSGVMVVTLLICWLLSQLTDPPFTDVIANLTLHDKHFLPFGEGRLTTTNLIYYASVTYGFLMLTTRTIRGRRWQ